MNNLVIYIPVVIAIITSIVAPVYLNSRKERGETVVRVIDEGRDFRQDLQKRIDVLELRLEGSAKDINTAYETIRELRTKNDRCEDLIGELRRELESANAKLSMRVRILEDDKGNT